MSQQADTSKSGRLRAGDESVLGEVWEACATALTCWLRAKFHGGLQYCDIEDALILALERMWERRTTFHAGKGTVESWFVAAVVNAARDILRASQARIRHCGPLVDPARVEHLISDNSSGDDESEEAANSRLAELLSDLRAILEELSQHQQSILRADAESPDGKASTRELAEELGLSESTVRVYRWSARKDVRQRLRERERERRITVHMIR